MSALRRAALLLALWTPLAPAATITIINADGPNEGLNDPAPSSADQGAPGLTLGQARLQALQFAADYWGARLDSAAEIKIEANLDPLDCAANSGLLGMAGSNIIYRRPGPNGDSTWHPAALVDALDGIDNDSGTAEIGAVFNSNVDNGDSCLPGKWYYGTDGNNGDNIDFVESVKHELAHGLGFSHFEDPDITPYDGSYIDGVNPSIWDHFIYDETRGANWVDLAQSQRAASYTNDQQVTWSGAAVTAVASQLSAGVHNSGRVKLYAPDPAEPGSSISHWDSSVTPDALMEAVSGPTGAQIEIAACLLRDIGWTLIGGDVCTGSIPTPSPTPTVSPTPTPTPAGNAAPTIGNLSSRATVEDNSVRFSVSLSDDNTPVEQLNVTAASSNSALIDTAGIAISLAASGAEITLQPLPDASGSATITLTVTDGGGLSASDSFTFTVNPANDAPTIAAIADQTGSEDQPLEVLLAIDDVDTALSSLTVTASSEATALLSTFGVSGSGDSRTLTINPALDASGTGTVTVTVDDGAATATRSFAVTIQPVNDAPTVVAALPTQQINVGEAVSIDLAAQFDDVDGDALSFAATGLPAGLSLSASSGRISGTVDAGQTANSPFTVQATASDPDGESAALSFDLVVTADAIDLGVDLSFAADRFNAGGTVGFALQINNFGNRAASQIVLNVILDGEGLSAPTLPAQCSTTATQPPFSMDCALDTLAAGASTTFSFGVTSSIATDVLVSAELSHANEDGIAANDQALRAVRVVTTTATGAPLTLGAGTVTALATADLDDDGELDLVLGTGAGEPVRVLFAAAGTSPVLTALGGTAEQTAAAVADIDGDGLPDVITGTAGGLVQVFANLGARNFRLQSTLAGAGVLDLVTADFDADGFSDIAALEAAQVEIIDGNGRRIASRAAVTDPRAIAAGDFDADGRIDLIVAAGTGHSQLLRNTGSLQFVAAAPFDSGDSRDVAAADVTGDSRLDLVFANRIAGATGTGKLLEDSASNRVYRGNGDLSFTELQRLGTIDSGSVSVADIDGDGDADVVFATGDGGLAVFRQAGGTFSADGADPMAGTADAVLATDLDGDGDADLVAIGDQFGVKAAINRGDGSFDNGTAPSPTPTVTPAATPTPTPTTTPSPTPAPSDSGGGSGRLSAALVLLLLAGLRRRRRLG